MHTSVFVAIEFHLKNFHQINVTILVLETGISLGFKINANLYIVISNQRARNSTSKTRISNVAVNGGSTFIQFLADAFNKVRHHNCWFKSYLSRFE